MLRDLVPFLSVATVAAAAAGAGGTGSSAVALAATGSVLGAPDAAPSSSLPAPPLPFFYDLYTFRGDHGGTDVIAAFAVQAGRLEREREEDHGLRYRFDVTLVLSDTAVGSVSRTDDSVYVSVPYPLAREHLLATHVEVEAPPSATTLQRVIMTDASKPGVGQLYGSPFPIPDYRGTHLMLSDVALGQPGATAGWTRGDVTLALLPTSQFPESEFDVYYEIYNLPFGNSYATEISIQPVDEFGTERTDEDATVRTRFSGESTARSGTSQNELRRVETSLPEGSYLLTVTVTDEGTGQTVSSSRPLQVRGWRPGTTLVPALPAKRTGAPPRRG